MSVPKAVTRATLGLTMQPCIGSPCSTYLVLRSRDVSPATSPAMSSGRCRHPPPVFRPLLRRDIRAAVGNLKI
ncbi:unnamed protein product [Staurois parvus]|uniref:Uncharacterized protein n=1 Tax=Staurois parvus TaxID=386267 RepID=A0ABN9CR03_9NEOB|nr:unnamed protein product [Staurois parvus]